jgi:hypothetical protein
MTQPRQSIPIAAPTSDAGERLGLRQDVAFRQLDLAAAGEAAPEEAAPGRGIASGSRTAGRIAKAGPGVVPWAVGRPVVSSGLESRHQSFRLPSGKPGTL